jgi:hypothetical protein
MPLLNALLPPPIYGQVKGAPMVCREKKGKRLAERALRIGHPLAGVRE